MIFKEETEALLQILDFLEVVLVVAGIMEEAAVLLVEMPLVVAVAVQVIVQELLFTVL
jgi:hypothetical protein